MKNIFCKMIIIGAVSLPLFLFENRKEIEVHADDGLIQLGTRAVTASGYEGIKTYISESDVERYQSTGRIVYSEIPGGPPVIESTGNQINGLNPDLPLPRVYYYYPTYTLPKIVDIVDLYNDWDSVSLMINELEKRVNLCSAAYTGTNFNTIEQSLDFIRSLTTSYMGGNWDTCAGSIDTSFMQTIANEGIGNMTTLLEFFSSFVSFADYNSALYGAISNSHFGTNLYDYIDTTHEYDLIHMFASTKCFIHPTEYSWMPKFEMEIDSLTSWGGDLQQAVKYFYEDIQDAPTIPTSFNQILDNPNSRFGWADFYADIDAKNIAYYGLDECTTLYDALNSLFDLSTHERFNKFAYTSLYDNGFSDFCLAAKCVLNLSVQPPNINYLSLYTNSFQFMRLSNNTYPSDDFRLAFYNLFIDKISSLGDPQ